MHIENVQSDRMGNDTRPEPAKRLEAARISRGFQTAKDASRFFGWVYESYIQHEQGVRGIGRQSKKYAEAFRVGEGWLLTGEGQGPKGAAIRMIPIVGYVGAGAEVIPLDEGAIDEIECPWSELAPDTVAVRVRGDSMAPAYYDRDLIFYERQETDVRHLLGKECVVALDDGRRFVKQLRRTGTGEWYLHSHNAEPILGIKISWAAKVRLIQRAE
jgi:SOS-response transcriptional repressor LexA